MRISAGVIGASGFSGGECLRLLASHPVVDIQGVGAASASGALVEGLHPHLTGLGSGRFEEASTVLSAEVDVLFSCLPDGVLPEFGSPAAAIVIDLAGDHRGAPGWVYGLPEWNADALPSSKIANPGCYPTAALLALLPFCRAGVIEGPVSVDGMSGASGAGRSGEGHLGFAHLHGSVAPYGNVMHKHVPEMERVLSSLGGLDAVVSFTPHLVPQARGLLITARAPLTSPLDDEAAHGLLEDAYRGTPFVHVVDEWPSTKPVAGTNRAHVSARVDERAGLLITSAAIDNLGKGAAGQAIQNMNIAFGLDEATGLGAFGTWP